MGLERLWDWRDCGTGRDCVTGKTETRETVLLERLWDWERLCDWKD